jgi:hypothetical protein
VQASAGVLGAGAAPPAAGGATLPLQRTTSVSSNGPHNTFLPQKERICAENRDLGFLGLCAHEKGLGRFVGSRLPETESDPAGDF